MVAALKIETVSTGNELLDGSIVDTNTQGLSLALRPLGLDLQRSTIVPDFPAFISHAVVEAVQRAHVVIISGGLGPTSDDLTLETVANAFGKELIHSKKAEKNVLNRLKKFKRTRVTEGHRKQMKVPEGATVLENQEGSAPGIRLTCGQTSLFFLPGIPREYNYILDRHVLPYLRRLTDGQGEYLFVLKVFGWAESALNDLVHSFNIPEGIEIGFRTTLPENHLKFRVRARSRVEAEKKFRPLKRSIVQKLGTDLFSDDGASFEESIFNGLMKKKAIVAIAESCTGGLVSSMITKVSGSSQILDRGFVTYSNQSKNDLLGVDLKTLEKYGAVSEEVAREMATGALKNSKANRALAITGIAGPSGGSRYKPVGTIWIAVASARRLKSMKLELHFDRELNQKYSAYAALSMLRDFEP